MLHNRLEDCCECRCERQLLRTSGIGIDFRQYWPRQAPNGGVLQGTSWLHAESISTTGNARAGLKTRKANP
jgi:hypothetical protein